MDDQWKIVYHYNISDPDCRGDYAYIELFKNGEVIKTFGDWYHDKGDTKVEAFLEGVSYALNATIDPVVERLADEEG